MKVRLLKPWGDYKIGKELEPSEQIVDVLLKNGFAELVREEREAETAEAPPAAERAVVQAVKPKRKYRRRKVVKDANTDSPPSDTD